MRKIFHKNDMLSALYMSFHCPEDFFFFWNLDMFCWNSIRTFCYLLGGNKSVFIHHIPKRRSQVREASDQLLSGWKIYISPVVSINFSMSDCRRCNARAVTGRGREAKPVSLLAAKQTTGLTGLTNQSLSIYYCLAVGRTFLFITSKAPLIELIFSSYFSVPSRNPKV